MDYSDFTIVIPVRIDSADRLRNLQVVTQSFRSLGVARVLVLEADTTSRIGILDGVRKIFVEDPEPLFFHTRYINMLCSLVETEFMGVWDCDVIVPQEQIKAAMDLLRAREADMVYPFDGRCYNVYGEILEQYLYSREEIVLTEHCSQLPCFYGRHTCGGASLVNKHAYIKAGGDNEKFPGWGPEDLERYKRWEIKGYRVYRIAGAVFHLHHERKENSRYYNSAIKQVTVRALLETCRMPGEYDNISIPVYIDTLKSPEEWNCLLAEFEKYKEFVPVLMESDNLSKTKAGEWYRIVQAVERAEERKDEMMIFCKVGHRFTKQYSLQYLVSQIAGASRQKAELLLGNLEDFETAVPAGYSRYWIDRFDNSQFIIIYSRSYRKILEYEYQESDTADNVLSRLFTQKMTLYPFVSEPCRSNRDTEVYPACANAGNEASRKLSVIDYIYKSYTIN